MTPPKKDSGEATEAEEKPEVAVVDENALPGEVWVENAHIFNVGPEVVRAALSLTGEGPYNRDQVANGIAVFMSRPVEQEG
jgi:hypothetical protein